MSTCIYYNPYLVRVQRQRLRPRLDPLGVVPGHLLVEAALVGRGRVFVTDGAPRAGGPVGARP